jgi:hypothetical protein
VYNVPSVLDEITSLDETVWTVENECPPLESDEPMASEKDFRDLSKEVASIKTTLDIWKWIVSGLAVAALAAVGWCWHLSTVVAVLQTGGNTQLLTELKEPKSPGQFRANLYTVIAQIETARAEGKQPDQKKMAALSDALSRAVQSHPEVPETWQAAAQLVDYKFQSISTVSTPLRNCLDSIPTYAADFRGNEELPAGTMPDATAIGDIITTRDCAIDLDDDGSFFSTPLGQSMKLDAEAHPLMKTFTLQISNARITYSGGKLLPFNVIEFTNCIFEVKPAGAVPNKIDQSITRQLLAVNPTHGKVLLPVG